MVFSKPHAEGRFYTGRMRDGSRLEVLLLTGEVTGRSSAGKRRETSSAARPEKLGDEKGEGEKMERITDWSGRSRTATARKRRSRVPFFRSPSFGREAVMEYDDPSEMSLLEGERMLDFFLGDQLASEIRERRGAEVEDFFRRNLFLGGMGTALIWSIRRHLIEALNPDCSGIGVLQKVNNSRWVNKYFRAVNSRLVHGGVFTGCAEVNGQRRNRILNKHPNPFGYAVCTMDFLVHRLASKVPLLKKAYFAVTRGHNRPLAASEVLGRLVSCGFEIIEHENIGGLMYFSARKIREAEFVVAPTYGPFCALRRIGREGRWITVYKFRTMHPYAEFLQDYVYRQNQLEDGGKFKDDFRITPWGKWLRRWWLDEAPMLLNLLKGEMKLVGVRPLSQQYFNLYPKDAQEQRMRHTPGLLPPFCVDMPKTFQEIVESEIRYLRAYERAPLRTDLRYFVVSLWNILLRKAKSA